MGAPSLDVDPSDADWTTELQTGAEDTAMRFGKRELRPHPLAKRIKVSQQLLRQALIGPEGLVLDRLAYKFAPYWMAMTPSITASAVPRVTTART